MRILLSLQPTSTVTRTIGKITYIANLHFKEYYADCKFSDYDFVFTYEGKAIATLVTRFYNDGELNSKSGEELEALMHE